MSNVAPSDDRPRITCAICRAHVLLPFATDMPGGWIRVRADGLVHAIGVCSACAARKVEIRSAPTVRQVVYALIGVPR